jgi:beta-lactamase class A
VTETAWCLVDRDGGVVAEENADEVFYPASTIKLYVMLAVLLAVEEGTLSLEDELVCTRTFPSAAPGRLIVQDPDDTDEEFPADGETLTVAALVRAMIERSSNEATDVLALAVGLPAVEAAIARTGARDTHMTLLIGDVAGRAVRPRNQVTARDLAVGMHAIVTGRAAGPEATAFMRRTLSAQRYPVIADVVPGDVEWGSKSGWIPGVEHDVAFLETPGDGIRALAVLTRDFADRDGKDEIRRVARALLLGSAEPDDIPV